MRGLAINLMLLAAAAVLALFVVKIFDDWYQDCEERRAEKRARRCSRRQHPSSSGPRYE